MKKTFKTMGGSTVTEQEPESFCDPIPYEVTKVSNKDKEDGIKEGDVFFLSANKCYLTEYCGKLPILFLQKKGV